MTSSSIGIRCRSLSMALLASLMSTHNRTPPGCFGFGTRTTGDTQGVGPVAGWIISCWSRDSTLASRFFLWWNGILLWDWQTGFTFSFLDHGWDLDTSGRCFFQLTLHLQSGVSQDYRRLCIREENKLDRLLLKTPPQLHHILSAVNVPTTGSGSEELKP